MAGSIAVLLDPLRRLRLLLDRPDQRRQLPHRSRIGRRPAPARQELPLGHDRADRRRRPRAAPKCRRCAARSPGVDGVEAVSPAGRRRAARDPGPGDARTEPLLDRGLRPGRADPRRGPRASRPDALVGGPTAVEFDVRDAAGWDSIVIPPIILARRLPDPDRPAARGGRAADPDRHRDPQLPGRARRRLLRLRRHLRLPRLGPLAAALRLRLPGRARGRLQHLPDRPRPRGDDQARLRTGHPARPRGHRRASSPAPASSSPAPSRCSPSSPSPSSPSSASSSPSASCSTPSSSAASSSPRSPSIAGRQVLVALGAHRARRDRAAEQAPALSLRGPAGSFSISYGVTWTR